MHGQPISLSRTYKNMMSTVVATAEQPFSHAIKSTGEDGRVRMRSLRYELQSNEIHDVQHRHRISVMSAHGVHWQ